MIQAVIGAQYGDEGKGLLVDALCEPGVGMVPLVVRANGGAQAGHTVMTPQGRRHEFHHIGAGAFRGAQTLLGPRFVLNPLVFLREFGQLGKLLHLMPDVMVDAYAPVTTPFDMLINVEAERARGASRHGSCGLGINETVERHAEMPLTVTMLKGIDMVDYLEAIRETWVPRRCAALGISTPTMAGAPRLCERFAEDCRMFARLVRVVDAAEMVATRLRWSADVVFEGAQGLGLDEKAPGFPHVTRSRTGLTNVTELLAAAGVPDGTALHARYVTRCYVTRHGKGYLANEVAGHPFGWEGPETNVENEHQGRLRYGVLSEDALQARVMCDLLTVSTSGLAIYPSLAVTCLDQTRGAFRVSDARLLAEAAGLPLFATSTGPTRDDVTYAAKEAAAR